MHIDGVKSELNFIKYDSYERRLILTNEGFFRVHNMLMGASSRAANQENPDNAYLGQFGEGMKLFMLLILTNNLTCFIESGSNYYGPELSQWQFEYVGGRVLHVNIRPRTQTQ